MDTFDAIITRRSTRGYSSAPVERDKLEKIIEAGRFAPSGGNNQTNHFIVVQNPDVLQKLATLAQEAFAKMEVTPETYSSLKTSILLSKKGGYVFHYNAPVLIIVANQKNYGNNMADCAVAVENMMIAANELDLGSCWINQIHWLTEDEKIFACLRSLGLKENERVYASMALGYAKDGKPNRKPLPRKGNEVTYV
ncbi:MAG: nitroreductase [Selenomonadaceae bacterium]|nr:nitroreductase [Selenomonadaceae bacterium]MBR6887766.1 nitroreductase [Selenomonadaceae bacterium]